MISPKEIKRAKWIGLDGFSFLLKPVFTMTVSLVIIRLAGVERWGEIVPYLVGIELMAVLLNWGQKPYLLKKFALNPSVKSETWSNSILARTPLFFFGLLIVVFLPVSSHIKTLLVILIFTKWVSSFFDSVIQFDREYSKSILSDALNLGLCLTVILWFRNNLTLENILVSICVGSFFKMLILLTLIPKGITLNSWGSVWPELKLAFPFFALTIAGLIQSKGDLYMVIYLLPNQEIAQYQVLIGFLIMGQSLSAVVLNPFQKNLLRINVNDAGNIRLAHFKIGVLVSVLLSVFIFLIMKYVYLFSIPFWMPVVYFLYLIPLYIYLIDSQIMIKHHLEKNLLSFTVYAAICNLGLSFILVPFIGIVGALISGIACRLLISFLVINKTRSLRY